MNRDRPYLPVILLSLLLRPLGAGAAESPIVIEDLQDRQPALDPTPPGPSRRSPTSTLFRHPLLFSDWWATTAYVDVDPGPGVLDYDCRAHTYAAHSGNDFAVRDFVDQDEGRFVLAAAPGLVVSTHDGEFDRRISVDPTAVANYVIVRHDDGTESRYWHLRKWSVGVAVGDHVLEGQPLGEVGSSGMATGPHLHFGVTIDAQVREPHSGTCNPVEPLWRSQLPHALDNPLTAYLTGVSTVDPLAGSSYLFRPPAVFHVRQVAGGATTYFWARLRYLHVGDELNLLYLDPDGTVFTNRTAIASSSAGLGHARWSTVLPATGGLGTWTALLRINGATVATQHFIYDTNDYALPVAEGRAVAVLYGAATGDLRGTDADSGIKEYRIVDPPAHGTVALSGPRGSRFRYVPESGFEGADPFTFEVEDAQGQVSAPATMTMNDAPVVADVLRLNGEDDCVSVPDNGSMNLTAGLTLEAWIRRTTGSAGWNMLFDRRNPSDETGFSFGIQPDGTLRFSVGDGVDATFADGTTPIPLDRFTHVAATWDGTMMRLFIDGVEEPGSVPRGGTIAYPGTYDTWLGRSRAPGESFRGEIDEMRIWSEARTASQLKQDATCSFYTPPPPATLVGWWRFDGDAQDSSAQGNHGAIVAPGFFRLSRGEFAVCPGLDADLDGVGDDSDNCPRTANPSQVDGDLDGLGDACDGCPTVFDPHQHDSDLDGIPDRCDVCPLVGDTEQADADGDGSGDLCDPLPGDDAGGVPNVIASVELGRDAQTGETTIHWLPDARAVAYQVIRGDLVELRARHYGRCISAGDPDATDTSFVDAESPASDELWGYVVVGVGASDARGRSSLDSDGRMRDLRAKDCR